MLENSADGDTSLSWRTHPPAGEMRDGPIITPPGMDSLRDWGWLQRLGRVGKVEGDWEGMEAVMHTALLGAWLSYWSSRELRGRGSGWSTSGPGVGILSYQQWKDVDRFGAGAYATEARKKEAGQEAPEVILKKGVSGNEKFISKECVKSTALIRWIHL